MPKQTDRDLNKPTNDTKETAPQIIARPDIPTLFIDKFLLTKRPDSNILFNGIQAVPGFEVEQLRLIISNDHARRLIEKLAQLINFYPEKLSVPSTNGKDVACAPNAANSDKKAKTVKASGNRVSQKASQKSKKQVPK